MQSTRCHLLPSRADRFTFAALEKISLAAHSTRNSTPSEPPLPSSSHPSRCPLCFRFGTLHPRKVSLRADLSFIGIGFYPLCNIAVATGESESNRCTFFSFFFPTYSIPPPLKKLFNRLGERFFFFFEKEKFLSEINTNLKEIFMEKFSFSSFPIFSLSQFTISS